MNTRLLLALLALAPFFALSARADAKPVPYPLATCLVSGEALGSMGDAYVFTYKEDGKPDREIRLCCKGCIRRFNREPSKYLAKLDTPAQPAAPAAPAAANPHAGHNH